MAKYAKSPDSLIQVKDAEGKEHWVTERAFSVLYAEKGYERLDSTASVETEGEDTAAENRVDFLSLSREELENVKNDDLKAFLDEMRISYKSDDKKEDLIDLILGE